MSIDETMLSDEEISSINEETVINEYEGDVTSPASGAAAGAGAGAAAGAAMA